MIRPAMFVTGLYGAPTLAPLGALAFLLLVIELPVVIIFVAITLASQRNGRSRASGGHQPPAPGRVGRAVEAEWHGSAGPDPASPGARTGQANADLRNHRSRRDRPRRRGQGVPVPRGARPRAGCGLSRYHLALNASQLALAPGGPDPARWVKPAPPAPLATPL